jgi:hypothetical protein
MERDTNISTEAILSEHGALKTSTQNKTFEKQLLLLDQVVNGLDNLIVALSIPLGPTRHIDLLKNALPRLRQQTRSIYRSLIDQRYRNGNEAHL